MEGGKLHHPPVEWLRFLIPFTEYRQPMTLTHILVLAAAAVPYLLLMPERGRKWALFVGSVIAIYWLQPKTTIRTLEFIFPSATLALVGFTWLISRDKEQGWRREDTVSAAIMVGVMILLTLERFFVESIWLTPSRPPSPLTVGMGVAIVIGVLALINQLPRLKVERSRLLVPGMLLIVVLFVILKTDPLAEEISRRFRDQMGQSTAFASATELQWLGFSYVAFRLIHTLRDRQTNKLPALSLREYTTYAIFFPSFTAGPIDRADRFLTDLHAAAGSRTVTAGAGRDADRGRDRQKVCHRGQPRLFGAECDQSRSRRTPPGRCG